VYERRREGTLLDVTTYRLEREPRHVIDRDEALLPGHYEADFAASDGSTLRRYLTDKGRTRILRALDAGQREFSEDDVREHTVEPDLERLVARMAAESGEGA